MQVTSIFGSNSQKTTRVAIIGIGAIVLLLCITGAWLLWALPDANAFNARVERIFVENDALTTNGEIKLLEILAQSGTAFSYTLNSYRMVIFVLLIFATGMLITALVFLVMLIVLNRRMAKVEAEGIQISSLLISRAENLAILNNMEFKLTDSALETLAVLAEARMDGDMLTGIKLEAMISGKPSADCDEAAGATRIKRLRDVLGNQMVSQLLIRNVARRGYVLAIEKDVIEMI